MQKLENRTNSLIYQRYIALKPWLWAHSRTQKYIMNNQYFCPVLLQKVRLLHNVILFFNPIQMFY